jgi:hypothetical protein
MSKNNNIWIRNALAAAVALACAQQAAAYEFVTDSGWKGTWNTTISAASAWRAAEQDKSLIGANDAALVKGFAATAGTNAAGTTAARNAGYLGAANADAGNLNYDKGDRYSTLFKIISEVTMSKGDMGFKLGAKAWYDQALKNENVPFGNQANGFNGATSALGAPAAFGGAVATLTTLGTPRPLSDANFPALNKFSGVELREAFVFNKFDLSGTSLDLKAGNQIVKWGNSLFMQGLSQVSPVDLTAVRKPGTEPDERLLPIWSLVGKLDFSNGMAVEGFYQLKHRSSSIESCGTYFGASDFGYGSIGDFCAIAQVAATSTGGWAGGSTDTRPDVLLKEGQKGRNGDWGLTFKLPVKGVGNFGFYAMNLSSRTPYLSGQVQPGTGAGATAGTTAGARMTAQWDYVNDIRLYGVTFLTKLDTWRVGAELSHTPNQPVQINANSIVSAGLTYASAGPVAGAATLNALGPIGQRFIALGNTAGVWGYFQGYDRFAKTQLLVNGATPLSKSITNALGAGDGRFAAELGYQRSGVPDVSVSAAGVPATMLYGRGFIFGLPVSAANCTTTGAAGTNPQPQGCQADGFFTKTAWGYRMRASLDYMNVFGTAWKMSPSVYWADDVQGYSVDGQFSKGRRNLTLGLGMSYGKQHEVQLGYTTFNRSANYDVFRDRDNVTAAYRYKF